MLPTTPAPPNRNGAGRVRDPTHPPAPQHTLRTPLAPLRDVYPICFLTGPWTVTRLFFAA